jgi:flagellar export protein FliJ
MAALVTYRLSALFDIRKRAKQKAEEAFVRAKHRMESEERTLSHMKKTLKDMISVKEQKRFDYATAANQGRQTIGTMNLASLHIKSLEEKEKAFQSRIDNQRSVLETAKKEVLNAQGKLTKASQELKALEKHKEKWDKVQRREIDKRDVETADDVAQTQFFETVRDKE